MQKLLLCLLLLVTPLALGEGIPDLGDVSQNTLSPFQERQIGLQSMLQIRASKQFYDDPEVNDYLNRIGNRLVEKSPEPSQSFEFFAVNDSSINAFAIPGGYIGVNTGLLLLTQSESELASVLGHEIAHVTQHHYARLLNATSGDSLAVMAAMAVAILAARSNPQAAQATAATAQASALQKQLDFTRLHEQEADRIGVDILQHSGYSVHDMPQFLERMQHSTRVLEGSAPNYLRTHPITSSRIADIQNRVDKLPYQLIPDSLDFQWVRARLLVGQKNVNDAVAYFDHALYGAQKFGSAAVQRYGLVLALLRSRDVARASREMALLQKEVPHHPMIAALAGRVLRAGTNNAAALAFYRSALDEFPQYRALVYDDAELLLQHNQALESTKLVADQITRYPTDARLYTLQARAYAQLNKPLEQHQAQAYAFYSQGNLRSAIQQLELAREAGGNFQQMSVIESDLRELREYLAVQPKK